MILTEGGDGVFISSRISVILCALFGVESGSRTEVIGELCVRSHRFWPGGSSGVARDVMELFGPSMIVGRDMRVEGSWVLEVWLLDTSREYFDGVD